MGIQPVRDVDLIRHAYVLPDSQGHGVGGALLEHLRRRTTRRMLIGTVGRCRLGNPLFTSVTVSSSLHRKNPYIFQIPT